jgi:L-ascorbate metabolism protein UlaG (beta-lactamase superfamily)
VQSSRALVLAIPLVSGACASPQAGVADGGTRGDTGASGSVDSAGSTSVAPAGSRGDDTSSGSVGSDATSTSSTTGGSDTTGEPPPEGEPLEVVFLGVGGVAVRHAGEVWMTAPFYTNPGLVEATFGEVASDPELVDASLPLDWVGAARAIFVGHGHYDHLMDVPHAWTKTDDARIYGNRSMAWLLAGAPEVPAERVVVLNDPKMPWVDRRMCDGPDPCTGVPADHPGEWVAVPGLALRVRALCSAHPPQFLGVVHFGEGCMAAPVDAPPLAAADWLEGATLAYLVDVLDPATGAPLFRIYYQDAPTDAPVGHPHPDLLAEKRVDLAILNVGAFTAVADHPEAIIEATDPRYVIGIHWENFFAPGSVDPIPFQADPAEFDARALTAIPDEPQPPLVVDGRSQEVRYVRPLPGTVIAIAPAPRP